MKSGSKKELPPYADDLPLYDWDLEGINNQPTRELIEKDAHPDAGRGRIWALWAFLAALGFGGTAYMNGYVATYGPSPPAYSQWFVSFIVWRSTGICGLAVSLLSAATSRRLPKVADTVCAAAAVFAGLCMVGGMLCMMNGLRQAPRSFGPFQAVVAGQSLVVAIAMAALFRELPSVVEAIGIALTVGGAAYIALEHPPVKEGDLHYTFAMYGCGTALCFAFAAVARRVAGRRGADPASVAVVECLVMYAAGQAADWATISVGDNLWGQTLDGALPRFWQRLLPWVAGVLHALAIYSVTRAHRTGVAGVVNAIAGFEPVVVLLLQLGFQSVVPCWEHFVGMGVAFAGVLVSSVGPLLVRVTCASAE